MTAQLDPPPRSRITSDMAALAEESEGMFNVVRKGSS
jgi:hypothetical protein